MNKLRDVGYVVEYSWLKNKPRWSASFCIDKAVGRYILFETKKKAKQYIKVCKDCGMLTRIIQWKREGELNK